MTYPARRHSKDVIRLQRSSGGAEAAPGPGPVPEPPLTTAALVTAWRASALHATLVAPATPDALSGVDLSSSPLARAQFGRPYVHAAGWHLWLLLGRQVLLNRRDKLFIGACEGVCGK